MALNATQVRKLKPKDKPFKLADGGGLHLYVTPKGSKLWRMRYRYDGKEKLVSFGPYPDVTLARAREKRTEAKALLADGLDPMAEAKAEKEKQVALNEHTFEKIASELVEKLRKEGKAETTLTKKRWYLNMANEAFGHMPITEITPQLVLRTLRKREAKGHHEAANRLRSTIGQVFRYAIATARADNDPTYPLRGALISPRVQHRAAITNKDEFAALIRDLWAFDRSSPSTRAALKLMALLYPRPGELRLVTMGRVRP